MHSDQPTLEDQLNRSALIERKAIQITKCETPQNFGIHGDWGAGKTSVLRQLRYHLDGNSDGCQKIDGCSLDTKYKDEVITIWFDAWRYQHESSPVIALLQEIRNQFCAWAKVKGEVKKLGEITIKSVLNIFDDITKLLKIESIPLNAKGIQQVGETWEKEHLEQRLKTDNILGLLQEAINTLLNKFSGLVGRRLVIFIDDLDRCDSQSAYRLLEGIKVYLDLKNCVFVFGLNQKVVTESIAKEVTTSFIGNNETELKILAEAYLEKICSSFERLSPPSNSGELFIKFLDEDYKVHFMDAMMTDQGYLNCFPPNPRRIKALSNLINLWLGQTPKVIDFDGDDVKEHIQALLIISYIHQYHSDLFHKLQYTPELYNEIKRWATTDWSSTEDEALSFREPSLFLTELKLPLTLINDQSSAIPSFNKSSSYPDPFSINMFWIQELLIDGNMEQSHINTIIRAIS